MANNKSKNSDGSPSDSKNSADSGTADNSKSSGKKNSGNPQNSSDTLSSKSKEGSKAVRRAAKVAGRPSSSGGRFGFGKRLTGFPMLALLIVVLGVGLVVFAYNSRGVDARPRQNEDHWHSPYGVWDCAAGESGNFEPVFQSTNDLEGIHSHQDGVIHIHPFFNRTAGKNATIDKFLNEMQASISEDAIVMPGGRELRAHTEEEPVLCDGEPAIIQVARWARLSELDKNPVIYTEDLGKVRFFGDGEAFVLARAPEGADIPPPPEERVMQSRQLSPQSIIDPFNPEAEGLFAGEGTDTEGAEPEAEADPATDTTADSEGESEGETDPETDATTDSETDADSEGDATTEEPADTPSDATVADSSSTETTEAPAETTEPEESPEESPTTEDESTTEDGSAPEDESSSAEGDSTEGS